MGYWRTILLKERQENWCGRRRLFFCRSGAENRMDIRKGYKRQMKDKIERSVEKRADVCVVGGGASGLMAAICAARQGASVLLLEKKNQAGKKLLATGNGRCNYSNRVQKPECYRGNSPVLCGRILERFPVTATVEWFQEIGILPVERDGYLYPASGQAASVLRALKREAERAGVELHTEEEVVSVRRWSVRGGQEGVLEKRQKASSSQEGVLEKQKLAGGFSIQTAKGCYFAGTVILATGGMAAPVHGSTGDGYGFAGKLGHHVIPPVPALTSLILAEGFTKQWAGVRIKGKVSLYNDAGKLLAEDRGELQMVSYGISGIPVFQVSRFAAVELAAGREVSLVLQAMPDWQAQELCEELLRRRGRAPEQSMGDLLDGILPDKLAAVYLKRAGNLIARPAGEIPEKTVRKLAELICHMKLRVKEVSGFDKAQVTAGGIPLKEIKEESMESLLCPGLYLAGELLDVDGICGGYNLQWAWTTGYLAGCAAGKSQGSAQTPPPQAMREQAGDAAGNGRAGRKHGRQRESRQETQQATGEQPEDAAGNGGAGRRHDRQWENRQETRQAMRQQAGDAVINGGAGRKHGRMEGMAPEPQPPVE